MIDQMTLMIITLLFACGTGAVVALTNNPVSRRLMKDDIEKEIHD